MVGSKVFHSFTSGGMTIDPVLGQAVVQTVDNTMWFIDLESGEVVQNISTSTRSLNLALDFFQRRMLAIQNSTIVVEFNMTDPTLLPKPICSLLPVGVLQAAFAIDYRKSVYYFRQPGYLIKVYYDERRCERINMTSTGNSLAYDYHSERLLTISDALSPGNAQLLVIDPTNGSLSKIGASGSTFSSVSLSLYPVDMVKRVVMGPITSPTSISFVSMKTGETTKQLTLTSEFYVGGFQSKCLCCSLNINLRSTFQSCVPPTTTQSGGLSTGAIVGIAVGGAVLVALVVVLIVLLVKRNGGGRRDIEMSPV
jgi:hypothetical protein